MKFKTEINFYRVVTPNSKMKPENIRNNGIDNAREIKILLFGKQWTNPAEISFPAANITIIFQTCTFTDKKYSFFL